MTAHLLRSRFAMSMRSTNSLASMRRGQRGASLLMVMLILVVVSMLGIGAAQISLMGERSARNDRDMQIAWQASEAALVDAEFDILGTGPTGMTQGRPEVFGSEGQAPNLTLFSISDQGCGTTGSAVGLCLMLDEAQAADRRSRNLPIDKWVTADFENSGNNADTTAYGAFTGQTFPFGSGVRPAAVPRYMVELRRDDRFTRDKSILTEAKYLYRVTAMGFGPKLDIQAVSQTLLRP